MIESVFLFYLLVSYLIPPQKSQHAYNTFLITILVITSCDILIMINQRGGLSPHGE